MERERMRGDVGGVDGEEGVGMWRGDGGMDGEEMETGRRAWRWRERGGGE